MRNIDAGMSLAPAVEAGWRLARSCWHLGLATEAARAAIAYVFDGFGLGEIIAYAVEGNLPSRQVMERVGMHYDPKDDFDDPKRAEDDPQRRHALYRIASNQHLRTEPERS